MSENYQSREARRKKQVASKNKKIGKKRNIFKIIFLTLFFIGIGVLTVGGITFAIYAKDAPPLDGVLLIDPIASEVLDMNGDVYAVLGPENRDYVNYKDIPKEVEDAVLATEDVRFYKHSGIDLRRLAGAVLANFTRGFGSEGASTITQQIVKLSFLSEEKTLKRKAQEAWLSFKLEQKYTKEQIFEIYVNKIFYANGLYGIETAAKYYFGKNLDELELQERAFLAGVPQRPSAYDPYKHPEAADKRKNLVLSLMHQHGKISQSEMEKAKGISITESLQEKKGTPDKYDSFVDQVIREVESLGDYNIYSDGLKIYTTLDPKAQAFTEKMLLTDEVINFPNDEMQAGIVLQDTKTGEVRAIGGNRYKDIKRGRNFATQLSDRQPGSTIKPVFDYGPAVEYLSWSTYEQIVDEPYKYSTGTPINNFDNRHLGQMSIREALYRSRNIPALKAFEAVGNDKVRDFAAKIGLEYDKIENDSAAIGSIENISPLKMAAAYATFGNNGMYNKPHTVKKIVLKDDTEVVNKIKPKLAMKDSTAFMVSSMLKDVISNKAGATGSAAIIPGLPAAGKTGTTNYTEQDRQDFGVTRADVPDAWFVGYTTNYSLAVWTGYETRKTPLRGGSEYNDQKIARQLYKELMAHVSEGIETADFQKPNSVVEAAVEKGSNPAKKPSQYTPKDQIVYEYFVAGTEPKEVSSHFDKLDAPKVSGEYNEETNEVTFTWSHPETEEKNLTFEASVKMSGGEKQSIDVSDAASYTIKDVEPGATYSIEVIAISENLKSIAGTASVSVPQMEEEEVEEEEEVVPPVDDEIIDEPEVENPGEDNGGESEQPPVEDSDDDGDGETDDSQSEETSDSQKDKQNQNQRNQANRGNNNRKENDSP